MKHGIGQMPGDHDLAGAGLHCPSEHTASQQQHPERICFSSLAAASAAELVNAGSPGENSHDLAQRERLWCENELLEFLAKRDDSFLHPGQTPENEGTECRDYSCVKLGVSQATVAFGDWP